MAPACVGQLPSLILILHVIKNWRREPSGNGVEARFAAREGLPHPLFQRLVYSTTMAESDPQQASGGEEKVGGGDVPEQQQEDFNPFSQAGRSIQLVSMVSQPRPTSAKLVWPSMVWLARLGLQCADNLTMGMMGGGMEPSVSALGK